MLTRTLIVCFDCCLALSSEESDHYVYQCHACVIAEHDLARLASRDPDHPEVARLSRRAVEPHTSRPRAKLT